MSKRHYFVINLTHVETGRRLTVLKGPDGSARPGEGWGDGLPWDRHQAEALAATVGQAGAFRLDNATVVKGTWPPP